LRVRQDAQIHTLDAARLAVRLSREVSKTAAIEMELFGQAGHVVLKQGQQTRQEQTLA
jgi:hypothetical protein